MLTGLLGTVCLPTGRPMPHLRQREAITEQETMPSPPMILEATMLKQPVIIDLSSNFFFSETKQRHILTNFLSSPLPRVEDAVVNDRSQIKEKLTFRKATTEIRFWKKKQNCPEWGQTQIFLSEPWGGENRLVVGHRTVQIFFVAGSALGPIEKKSSPSVIDHGQMHGECKRDRAVRKRRLIFKFLQKG